MATPKDLLNNPELLKWLVNQGISSLILIIFMLCSMYLSFTYIPIFVNHVGSLAESTEKIDMHLAEMVSDTSDIKANNQDIIEAIQEIKKKVIENNAILRTK